MYTLHGLMQKLKRKQEQPLCGGEATLVDMNKEDGPHVIHPHDMEMETITATRSCEAETHDIRTRRMFLLSTHPEYCS